MIDRILPEPYHEGVTGDPVHAAEIPWAVDPLPPIEVLPLADLLTLDAGALVAYVIDLQAELEAVRTVLHESLHALHEAHHQRDRLQIRMRQLLDALRTARGIGGER